GPAYAAGPATPDRGRRAAQPGRPDPRLPARRVRAVRGQPVRALLHRPVPADPGAHLAARAGARTLSGDRVPVLLAADRAGPAAGPLAVPGAGAADAAVHAVPRGPRADHHAELGGAMVGAVRPGTISGHRGAGALTMTYAEPQRGTSAADAAPRSVLLYSDDPQVRDRMRLAIGTRPAADLEVEFVDSDSYAECI